MNIREKLIQLLEGAGYTQKQVATKSKLSTAVVSQYLSGSYSGNIANVEAALGDFIRREEERAKRREVKEAFVHTRLADMALTLITETHLAGDIGVIYGPAGNRDVFHHEASQLRHIGFTVLNPAIFPDGLEHHQYLAMTLVMLEQANAIYLLEGWENSVGAKAEVIRARELNLMFLGQSWEVLWAAAAFRSTLPAANRTAGGAFDVGGILYRPPQPGEYDFGQHQTEQMRERHY